ncbi:serine/threonine-protein kinase STK11 [Pelomyxa schiedti]|nr:serine/threonine-protein kinase STK11 [Pelomyxa schiedti]
MVTPPVMRHHSPADIYVKDGGGGYDLNRRMPSPAEPQSHKRGSAGAANGAGSVHTTSTSTTSTPSLLNSRDRRTACSPLQSLSDIPKHYPGNQLWENLTPPSNCPLPPFTINATVNINPNGVTPTANLNINIMMTPNYTASSPTCTPLSSGNVFHSPTPTHSPAVGDFNYGVTRLADSEVVYRTRTSPKPCFEGRVHLGYGLGQGAYAKVKEGYDTQLQKRVAVKILKKNTLSRIPGATEALIREIDIMRTLEHPNVVYFVANWEDRLTGKIYIAQEYVSGGTLFDLMRRAPKMRIPFTQAHSIFQSLLSGLSYIHGNHIFHRDIKPDNCLLCDNLTIKICDFGCAVRASPNSLETIGVGSPAFQPPEVAKDGKTSNGYKLDSWAAGVTLFYMTVGEFPFPVSSNSALLMLYEILAQCSYDVPSWVPEDLSNLLRCILVPNPEERFSVEQILSHRWMQPEKSESSVVEPENIPTVPAGTMFSPEVIQSLQKKRTPASLHRHHHRASVPLNEAPVPVPAPFSTSTPLLPPKPPPQPETQPSPLASTATEATATATATAITTTKTDPDTTLSTMSASTCTLPSHPSQSPKPHHHKKHKNKGRTSSEVSLFSDSTLRPKRTNNANRCTPPKWWCSVL